MEAVVFGVSFADDLKVGDVLLLNPKRTSLLDPVQVRKVGRYGGMGGSERVGVELMNGSAMMLEPGQSLIIGREPEWQGNA